MLACCSVVIQGGLPQTECSSLILEYFGMYHWLSFVSIVNFVKIEHVSVYVYNDYDFVILSEYDALD